MNKKLIKLISCLIPVKKWRKKFRNYFEKTGKSAEMPLQATKIPTIELYFQQYNTDKTFNRYDIIVRLLAIENYYNENNFGWALYKKMQNFRIKDGYSELSVENFIKLIQSWEKYGYDIESKITVNKNIELLDGSHRLALALYYKTKELAVKVENTDNKPLYGIDWFVCAGGGGDFVVGN